MHPRDIGDADDESLPRLQSRNGLSPRVRARPVQEDVPLGLELRGCEGDIGRAGDFELNEHLGHRPTGGPPGPPEARLRGLGEGPDAEVPPAPQSRTVEEVGTVGLPERQAESLDVELPTFRKSVRDESDGANEYRSQRMAPETKRVREEEAGAGRGGREEPGWACVYFEPGCRSDWPSDRLFRERA